MAQYMHRTGYMRMSLISIEPVQGTVTHMHSIIPLSSTNNPGHTIGLSVNRAMTLCNGLCWILPIPTTLVSENKDSPNKNDSHWIGMGIA